MLPTLAVNEDADFVGYMENLEQLERDRERINKILEAHEVSEFCSLCYTVAVILFQGSRSPSFLYWFRNGGKRLGEDLPYVKFKQSANILRLSS